MVKPTGSSRANRRLGTKSKLRKQCQGLTKAIAAREQRKFNRTKAQESN